MDRIRQAMAWANEQLEAMSPRDRLLFTALVSGLGVALAAAIVFGAYNLVQDANSRLSVARDRFVDAQDLADEQAVLAAKLAAAEARMDQFDPSQAATYVERWAQEAGVADNLKEVRETATAAVGAFRERDYRVELDDALLPNVVKFLYALESAPFPVRVRNATFKARSDRKSEQRLMDVELEVVTYSRDEGEG